MRRALLLLGLALAGCSGSSSGGTSGSTGSTGGTLVGDEAFAPNTTVAFAGPGSDFLGHPQQVRTFDISPNPITCDSRKLADGGFAVSQSFFEVIASGSVQGATLPGPGHYPDDAGNSVVFIFQLQSGQGINIDETGAGTIDVESVSPNFKGSFSTTIPFADGGGSSPISGTFDAPYCN